MPKKNLVHSAVRVLLKKTAQLRGMSLLVATGKELNISDTVAQYAVMYGICLIVLVCTVAK